MSKKNDLDLYGTQNPHAVPLSLFFFIIYPLEDIKRACLLAYGQCIHSLLVEMTLPALSWFLIPSKDSFKNFVVATKLNPYFKINTAFVVTFAQKRDIHTYIFINPLSEGHYTGC